MLNQKEITEWIEETLDGTDAFIYNIQIQSQPKKLLVFLDSDSGLNIDLCTLVNRMILEKLEIIEPDHAWNIEVSSPGVDRPLLSPRQYVKHAGRKIKVITLDGKEYINTLKETHQDEIIIGEKITNLLTKRKPKPDLPIPFEQIKESYIII